jgi:hypothetical protein
MLFLYNVIIVNFFSILIIKQLDYNIDYNSDKSFSKSYDEYLKLIVKKIMKSLKYTPKRIVEVGAGDCHFAETFLKIHSSLEFFVFDKNIKQSVQNKNLFKNNKFYIDQNVKPDLVIARHTLEHIFDIKSFLSSLIHESPEYLFIEVPCSSFVLDNNFHYFSYEHCSYFDKYSLNLIMNKFGYFPLFIDYAFNNENIISLFVKDSNDLKEQIFPLEKKITMDFNKWKSMQNIKMQNGDIIWGASGKGVMLFNILEQDYKTQKKVVDSNVSIQGMFSP